MRHPDRTLAPGRIPHRGHPRGQRLGRHCDPLDENPRLQGGHLDPRSVAAGGRCRSPRARSTSHRGRQLDSAHVQRWEMKTRNRGEDFVKHRLRKVASCLAVRDEREVPAGLEGTNVRDEAGNEARPARRHRADPAGAGRPSNGGSCACLARRPRCCCHRAFPDLSVRQPKCAREASGAGRCVAAQARIVTGMLGPGRPHSDQSRRALRILSAPGVARGSR